jgi:uncharacterized protein (DUF1810 family)
VLACGLRLIECAGILDAIRGRSAEQIFGRIDSKKLQSSMMLFLRAASREPVFGRVLDRYFAGMPDGATDQRLQPCKLVAARSAVARRTLSCRAD